MKMFICSKFVLGNFLHYYLGILRKIFWKQTTNITVMAKVQNVYLESKPRYEILDGLRGVAALLVVAFHLFETYSKGTPYQIINHGYLAVDFFFVLSGFVIGYAYDDRWSKMTLGGFFKRRLTRLQPMMVIGTVVGLLMFYFGINCSQFGPIATAPAWKIALCFVLGIFMIPVTPKMDIRGWQESYPLNGPQWSLMLEYIGNILYALFFRRMPKWLLACFVGLFALLTLNFGLGWDVFGTLGHYSGRFAGGWSITEQQLWIGFTRLLYPFFCGLLIQRIGKFIKVKNAFLWCSLILIAVLSVPRIGAAPSFSRELGYQPGGVFYNGLYESLIILIVFPLLVLMGAGGTIKGKCSMKFCKFLGDISYPIYITHYPMIYAQMSWQSVNADAPVGQHIMVSVGFFFLSILLAWACLKFFDEPTRKWLTEHWLKGKKSKAATAEK